MVSFNTAALLAREPFAASLLSAALLASRTAIFSVTLTSPLRTSNSLRAAQPVIIVIIE